MCNHEHKIEPDVDYDRAYSGGMIILGAILLAIGVGVQFGIASGFFIGAFICGSLSYLIYKGLEK